MDPFRWAFRCFGRAVCLCFPVCNCRPVFRCASCPEIKNNPHQLRLSAHHHQAYRLFRSHDHVFHNRRCGKRPFQNALFLGCRSHRHCIGRSQIRFRKPETAGKKHCRSATVALEIFRKQGRDTDPRCFSKRTNSVNLTKRSKLRSRSNLRGRGRVSDPGKFKE